MRVSIGVGEPPPSPLKSGGIMGTVILLEFVW